MINPTSNISEWEVNADIPEYQKKAFKNAELRILKVGASWPKSKTGRSKEINSILKGGIKLYAKYKPDYDTDVVQYIKIRGGSNRESSSEYPTITTKLNATLHKYGLTYIKGKLREVEKLEAMILEERLVRWYCLCIKHGRKDINLVSNPVKVLIELEAATLVCKSLQFEGFEGDLPKPKSGRGAPKKPHYDLLAHCKTRLEINPISSALDMANKYVKAQKEEFKKDNSVEVLSVSRVRAIIKQFMDEGKI